MIIYGKQVTNLTPSWDKNVFFASIFTPPPGYHPDLSKIHFCVFLFVTSIHRRNS